MSAKAPKEVKKGLKFYEIEKGTELPRSRKASLKKYPIGAMVPGDRITVPSNDINRVR